MTDQPSQPTLQKAKTIWEEKLVAKTLHRFPERQKKFTTTSGIDVDRLYIPAKEQLIPLICRDTDGQTGTGSGGLFKRD